MFKISKVKTTAGCKNKSVVKFEFESSKSNHVPHQVYFKYLCSKEEYTLRHASQFLRSNRTCEKCTLSSAGKYKPKEYKT